MKKRLLGSFPTGATYPCAIAFVHHHFGRRELAIGGGSLRQVLLRLRRLIAFSCMVPHSASPVGERQHQSLSQVWLKQSTCRPSDTQLIARGDKGSETSTDVHVCKITASNIALVEELQKRLDFFKIHRFEQHSTFNMH